MRSENIHFSHPFCRVLSPNSGYEILSKGSIMLSLWLLNCSGIGMTVIACSGSYEALVSIISLIKCVRTRKMPFLTPEIEPIKIPTVLTDKDGHIRSSKTHLKVSSFWYIHHCISPFCHSRVELRRMIPDKFEILWALSTSVYIQYPYLIPLSVIPEPELIRSWS